jgi:hypothetical protein
MYVRSDLNLRGGGVVIYHPSPPGESDKRGRADIEDSIYYLVNVKLTFT